MLKPIRAGNMLRLNCERCPEQKEFVNRRFPPSVHADTEELLFLLAAACGWQVEPPLCPLHRRRAGGGE